MHAVAVINSAVAATASEVIDIMQGYGSGPQCPHDPRPANAALGMYQCGSCGCMVTAGLPHTAHDAGCEYDSASDAAIRRAAYQER